MTPPVPVAKGQSHHSILPRMANRHGLVAGATGTGKTVTLRVLAERFSSMGVPVFAADVKGDLSGLALPGTADPKLEERAQSIGIAGFSGHACPTILWDVFGEQGHPVRATVSEMGPILLARLLDLNEVQSGVLSLVFRIADEEGLLLLDLKDLRAMLRHAADNAKSYGSEFGNISPASVGAIQRSLLALEDEGALALFGEPALRLTDFLRVDGDGRGFVNILAADRLIRSPRLYATFLLWLLAELFEQLPEVGDPEKPRLVFFFDEAHLLFDEAPKVLQDRIEQVVRLVRSKGVGIYFVSQSPLDIPDDVLGQLGHRVQHALRAFTPRDRKALEACAETFRASPGLDLETAISELGVGEAIVSFLDAEGRPEPADRCRIAPPGSRLVPLSPAERADVLASSPVAGRYEQAVDRESAYEILRQRASEASSADDDELQPPPPAAPKSRRPVPSTAPGAGGELLGALARSAAHAVGSQVGRQLVRGLLGSILGPAPRRRRR